MTVDSLDTLVREVVASSVAHSWSSAVEEWEVVELEEDLAGQGVCVCGQTGLVKLFTIRNEHTDRELYPIGSVCVNQFGRADLNHQVTLFSDLHALRSAILARKNVTLTSEFFSRAMLEYFLHQGAFTPDSFNNHDGEGDFNFLTDMFNKRDKDAISQARRSKIYVLLQKKVLPFVLADERLK